MEQETKLFSGRELKNMILLPLFLRVHALEPETKRLVIWLVLIHNVFNAVAFPFSGALSNGLRAVIFFLRHGKDQ